VQFRTTVTTNVEEDSASSRGLFRRLLPPGSFRMARFQGEDSTISPHASGDDDDPTVDDSGPGIQDEDDEDYETEYSYWGRPYARTPKWFPPVTTPHEAGTKLLMSGEFGRIGVEARSREGSANFSKAILSSRSKLRPTPKQDVTNVRTTRSICALIFFLMTAGPHPEHCWYRCRVAGR
jgi:hypothetical protein